jgi:hypothetical protein
MRRWREVGCRVREQGFDGETADYFENLKVDGRITLKWTVRKCETME